MTPDLISRCKDLVSRGRTLASRIQYDEYGHPNYWFHEKHVSELQSWIASVANFFRLCATPDTYFMQEVNRVVEDEHLSKGVPFYATQKLVGLLESIAEEMDRGLMRKAEYIFVASTFDDFLDHADDFHKSNKKVEASVLASTVYEDAIRRFAKKMDVQQASRSLDTVIDELVKKGATTPIKAKRWKGYAGIRNSALHAQWDDFDIRDVGELIKGTKEIIESL